MQCIKHIFFSNNPAKVAEYKKYANKLNWLKNTSKKSYFCQHFDLCKNNLRASWRLIGMLIKRNSKGQTPIPKVIRNNRVYTDKAEIADQFNKHFVEADVGSRSILGSYVPVKDNVGEMHMK